MYLERIKFAINIFKNFEVNGYIADVSCGTKEVGIIANAHFYYDYHQYDEEVRFINLKERGNDVVKVSNIYFFHAIEHFKDVKLTLRILRDEFLEDGGRIFIACPNAKYDNKFRPFDLELGHYSEITVEYLKQVLNELG